MAGIEEVLERLVSEPGFRTRLTSRPWAALDGYDLSEEEREILAVRLIAEPRPEPASIPEPGLLNAGVPHPPLKPVDAGRRRRSPRG